MQRTSRTIGVAALLLASAAASVAASATDLSELNLALGVLPRIDRFEVDFTGHLNMLEGQLTPPGPSPPGRAAAAFLAIHARLFDAAAGSVFRVEQVAESGGRTSVVVRQLIDGFRVEQGQLRLDFTESGALVRLAGVVLRDDDVASAAADTLSRDRAVEIARSTARGQGPVDLAGARRVILNHRRCWQLELHQAERNAIRSTLVTVDAANGTVLGSSDVEIAVPDGVPLHEGGPKGDLAISGCAPLVPSIGEFDTAEGQQLWTGAHTGCGRWMFDPKMGASLFHGNCLDYECDPYPATDQCDHGEIKRTGLSLPSGYERVRLEVETPNRELFVRLRWGRSILDAAPFLIPVGAGATTVVELDLAGYESWDSSTIDRLTLELVDDYMIWLRALELSPGPWLELARGPNVAPHVPGEPLVSGESVTVLQDVRNLGCQLEEGTHEGMRSVSYRLYELLGSLRRFESTVCAGAQIPGSIPPESSARGLPMCDFELPAAGTWEIEGRFDSHPAPSESSTFVVEPSLAPNLSVDLSQPIDLYSGWLGTWPCRADVLDRARYDDPNPPCNLPYIVTLETAERFVTDPVTTQIAAWTRPRDPAAHPTVCDPDSGGWYSLGDPVSRMFGVGDLGPVELPIERDRVMALPLGADGWSLVDLKVAIEPIAGELDLDDNRACIAAWLPVTAGDVASTLGPTWVADDYFLDPAHWPPHGLTASGVTLAHEEGSVHYDPESALAALAVDDGANEPPRVIWFEALEGRTVAGLLVRYRRAEPGYGGAPFLDGGSAEGVGLPEFELDVPGHPNRSLLEADNQWRSLAWRRGDAAPFGSFSVPQLVSPEGAGPVLSLHLAPDRNCLLDEPGCPSGLRPETMLDVVAVWYADGPPVLEPRFTVDGLRVFSGEAWLPAPATVMSGDSVQYGVEVRNVGNAMGTAVLTALVEIRPLNESSILRVLTGSETVLIPAGASHVLRLDPVWLPISAGSHRLLGWVQESGLEIGQVNEMVEVLDPGPGCPVPIASLP